MRMLWPDLREAMEKLGHPGSLCHTLAAIVCGLGVALAGPSLLGQQVPETHAPGPKRIHHAAKPKPAVPESIPEVILPAPPPPERRTLEQMPPGVPQVSWDGNVLTITADNSTLADILVAIRTRTGADIDVPPNASGERIAARLGPGPAREIIATLLSWTDFDYLIQASDTDPAGIQSVILTYRGKPEQVVAKNAAETPPSRWPNRKPTPAEVQEPSGAGEAETPTEVPMANTQPPPTQAQPAPAVATSDPPIAPADGMRANLNLAIPGANSDLNPPLANTPDERLQTLQSLYQQRKQMIQDSRKPPAN